MELYLELGANNGAWVGESKFVSPYKGDKALIAMPCSPLCSFQSYVTDAHSFKDVLNQAWKDYQQVKPDVY